MKGQRVSSFLHHITLETGILQEHSVDHTSTFRAFQPRTEGYFHPVGGIGHVK